MAAAGLAAEGAAAGAGAAGFAAGAAVAGAAGVAAGVAVALAAFAAFLAFAGGAAGVDAGVGVVAAAAGQAVKWPFASLHRGLASTEAANVITVNIRPIVRILRMITPATQNFPVWLHL